MTTASILSHSVDIARIPPSGLKEAIVASESQRRGLAVEYGLVAVDVLAADVSVSRGESDSLVVEGHILADVVQSCVVSLEPVPQHIDERFSVRFVPPGSAGPGESPPDKEVVIDQEAEDAPEILAGGSLDLGGLVEEHFVLAIDPYPRAPDAEIPPEGIDKPAAGEDSPFAVLAGLKKSDDGG